MTYFGMPFHLMTFARFWIYIKSTYFLPYILLYIANYLIVQRRILSDRVKKVKGDKRESQEEIKK
jgi:purine-cytosine permease-like protein